MAGDKYWLPLVPSFVYLYPDRRTYLSVGVSCFQLLTFHLDVFFPFGYVEMPNKGNWDTAVPTSSVGITTPWSQMSCKCYHIATSASLFCAHHQNVAFCVGFQGFLKKEYYASLFCFLFLNDRWFGNIVFTLIIISPFFSIKQQLLSVIASLSGYFLAPKESNHSDYIHLMHLVVFLKLPLNIICPQ